MSTAPAAAPERRLPHGYAVRLAHDVHVCDGGRTLLGGASGRLVHLKPAAVAALGGGDRLAVSDPVTAAVARLLLDRGLADPQWDEPAETATSIGDVTVVVPAHGRAAPVARLLAALPAGLRVIVVDDASPDPDPLAHTASRAGAELVRREENGGPAAARNTGLTHVRTPFVAFLDSDVVPARGSLHHLRRHFDDPTLGLVAPRVLGLHEVGPDAAAHGWLGRYEAARSSLDLGPHPGRVASHSRIGYVPSAALMARVDAVAGGFEESMRVAEDVDLVWRVGEQGWSVRYDPAAVVRHEHRTDTREWLSRKAFYGTGAAVLAERHGDAVAPMVVTPWTAVVTVAALAGRRWSLPVAAAATGVAVLSTARKLERSDHPHQAAATMVGIGLAATLRQTMSSLTRHHWPVAVGAALVSRRARRALAVAALLDAALDLRASGADLDPARYLLARRLDDLAYGAGVWIGVARRLGLTGGDRHPRAALALLPALRGIPTRRPRRTS